MVLHFDNDAPLGFLKATYVTPGVSYGSDFKGLVKTSSNPIASNAHAVFSSSDSIVVADLSFSQRLLII
ncbi:hypothetical protein P8452_34534 [Trifolium repens]|nr:hypothetical protein P8452_34534 [Trifolium repens]